jgi:sterol desaturase/sphingolipid hydroxylase (fatty acid hydroxylase superfamily)
MIDYARLATRDAARNKFRKNYREGIKPNYSGWAHLLSMLGWGCAVIYLSLAQVTKMGGFEWLIFAGTMVVYNFLAEYVMHRWAGHKKTKLMKFVYQRHTGDHHTFFDDAHMAYEGVMDWRVVLFPLYLILTVTFLIAVPLGVLVYFVLGWNAAFVAGATSLIGYLFYEVMHFSYHLPEGTLPERLFRLIPGWRAVRHLHVLHHKRDIMHDKNFNVTIPLFDILLGTFYWQPYAQFEAERAEWLEHERQTAVQPAE